MQAAGRCLREAGLPMHVDGCNARWYAAGVLLYAGRQPGVCVRRECRCKRSAELPDDIRLECNAGAYVRLEYPLMRLAGVLKDMRLECNAGVCRPRDREAGMPMHLDSWNAE